MNAENLAEIKRIVGDWHNSHYQINERIVIAELLEHIDEQASQISALKAALIRERERYLDDFIHQDEPMEDRSQEAALQLARELPEIDWGDVK
jgi:hypothetical protein